MTITGRNVALSLPATECLDTLRKFLIDKSSQDEWPHEFSGSIMVELLFYWFEETRHEGKTEVKLSGFYPQTKCKGRPQLSELERTSPSRAVAPAEIRKLAGIDPVTGKRKLY